MHSALRREHYSWVRAVALHVASLLAVQWQALCGTNADSCSRVDAHKRVDLNTDAGNELGVEFVAENENIHLTHFRRRLRSKC